MAENEAFGKAIVRLRLVRGTYLDQMVTFEGVLDSHLYSYLGGPEEHRWLAYYSFLQRMGLRAKVETFCQFVTHSGLTDEFPDLCKRLRDAVRFRNDCAHAIIHPDWGPTGDLNANAYIPEWQQGRMTQRRITAEDFDGQLDEVPALLALVSTFMGKVLTERENNGLIPQPMPD